MKKLQNLDFLFKRNRQYKYLLQDALDCLIDRYDILLDINCPLTDLDSKLFNSLCLDVLNDSIELKTAKLIGVVVLRESNYDARLAIEIKNNIYLTTNTISLLYINNLRSLFDLAANTAYNAGFKDSLSSINQHINKTMQDLNYNK